MEGSWEAGPVQRRSPGEGRLECSKAQTGPRLRCLEGPGRGVGRGQGAREAGAGVPAAVLGQGYWQPCRCRKVMGGGDRGGWKAKLG